jgi:uncharacterized protein (TIGR03437 family)
MTRQQEVGRWCLPGMSQLSFADDPVRISHILVSGLVAVTIGSKSAQVTFKGLAPGFVGLAQLNVIVPAGPRARGSTGVCQHRRISE